MGVGMKQIFWILVIVLLVIVGVGIYSNSAQKKVVNSGDIFTHDQAHEKLKVGDSMTDAPAQTVPDQQVTTAAQINQTGMVAAPVSDTIRRNPPNGMVFSGSGRFQLYRQGDITWRVNTDSGQACVIFATDEEWRKERVLRHGCGNN